MKRLLLGMSGGVDSAAAAVLLLRAGYEVEGATLLLAPGGAQDAADAARCAAVLGIPHRTVDLRGTFRREVMDVFAAEYRAGRTPNPCVLCNRAVKFGAMLRLALEAGFDGVATGHYARIEEAGGRFLLRASPTDKDQSYMLYSLSQEQLGRAVLPLAELSKSEVRALAREAGLPAAQKPESQDICFVPDGDYAGFLSRALRGSPSRRGILWTPRATCWGATAALRGTRWASARGWARSGGRCMSCRSTRRTTASWWGRRAASTAARARCPA